MRRDPLEAAAMVPRLFVATGALALGVSAGWLFYLSLQPVPVSWVDWARTMLIGFSVFWLGWGALTALLGLLWRPAQDALGDLDSEPMPSFATAIVIPIYNENAGEVFARLRIMRDDLMAAGCVSGFDFHVLSDTRDADRVEVEKACYREVARDPGLPVYYRNRTSNEGRKAGNIKEFVTRSGGAYEAMIILDADSLMTARCMMRMVKAVARDPKLGLLQTLPVVIGAETVFARIIAFATGLYGRTFARGLALLQGRCGPFWGHNAIVRTRAFAQSCGLPVLPGEGPLAGHIMSHDTVEGALLARRGWTVRCDPDLEGSYEEVPAHLLGFAARDRRWCQGNLQHGRVLLARGLPFWSRMNIGLGIIAYSASALWFSFLVLSLISAGTTSVYERTMRVFLALGDFQLSLLLGLIIGLLFLPKLLVALAGLAGYQNGILGNLRVLLGYAVEAVSAIFLAPILMMFQSRGIMEILMGRDSGWTTAHRDHEALRLSECTRATFWMSVVAALGMAMTWYLSPLMFFWSLPVALPVLLAPVLVWITAKPVSARGAARLGLIANTNQVLGGELRRIADV